MLFEIGQVCIKLAGRDAGKTCVIVESLEDPYVMIDGQTRRRKCNVSHLEPTNKMLDISSGADTATVAAALEKEGIVVPKQTNPKKATDRTRKSKVQKSTKSADKKKK